MVMCVIAYYRVACVDKTVQAMVSNIEAKIISIHVNGVSVREALYVNIFIYSVRHIVCTH